MEAVLQIDFQDRYFNPDTGRFLSEDPTGFGGRDYNLYRYVSNSPINYIDPSGLIGLVDPVESGAGSALITTGGVFAYYYISMHLFDHELADSFFHCVANCEGSKSSQFGSSIAEHLSDLCEFIQNESSACRESDQRANRRGREAAQSGESCKKACLDTVRPGPTRNKIQKKY